MSPLVNNFTLSWVLSCSAHGFKAIFFMGEDSVEQMTSLASATSYHRGGERRVSKPNSYETEIWTFLALMITWLLEDDTKSQNVTKSLLLIPTTISS